MFHWCLLNQYHEPLMEYCTEQHCQRVLYRDCFAEILVQIFLYRDSLDRFLYCLFHFVYLWNKRSCFNFTSRVVRDFAFHTSQLRSCLQGRFSGSKSAVFIFWIVAKFTHSSLMSSFWKTSLHSKTIRTFTLLNRMLIVVLSSPE